MCECEIRRSQASSSAALLEKNCLFPLWKRDIFFWEAIFFFPSFFLETSIPRRFGASLQTPEGS